MTFPVSEFSDIDIYQEVDTRIPDSRYFRNRARGNKAPFFVLALTTTSKPYFEYMALFMKISAYEDALELFAIPNPLPARASFSNTNVNATASRGSKSVDIAGNRSFEVGDFVQFDNHQKAYGISSVSESSGVTTVGLSCPLVEEVTTSEQMIYGANVVFQMCIERFEGAKVSAKRGKEGILDVELIEQG